MRWDRAHAAGEGSGSEVAPGRAVLGGDGAGATAILQTGLTYDGEVGKKARERNRERERERGRD